MKLIIVSGRSGSGKSTALHVLEDLGFYCIDNLPIGLLFPLTRRFRLGRDEAVRNQVAVVSVTIGVDLRLVLDPPRPGRGVGRRTRVRPRTPLQDTLLGPKSVSTCPIDGHTALQAVIEGPQGRSHALVQSQRLEELQ